MLKILTIDDSRVMRQMLEATLSGAGHTAIQAVDGQEGLEKLDTVGHVDLIITDINMPRLDGFGFIEKARQHASHRATPILVLSTESSDEKKARAPARKLTKKETTDSAYKQLKKAISSVRFLGERMLRRIRFELVDCLGECAAQGNARNVRFERREFTHPDTLRPVARVQAAIGLREPINVRACPACGGNPNEQEPVTR